MRPFQNRSEAGRQLAAALENYADQSDLLVLALPRGGVPVAFEVAKSLHAPLDVFIVRKLGVPGHKELAMGAISSGGGQVLNMEVIEALAIDRDTIEAVASHEWHEIERREDLYRPQSSPVQIQDKTVIVIDDGLATGSTMLAGVKALRHLSPKALIAAVPLAPAGACADLRVWVDEMICLIQPENFYSVGQWYQDFTQTEDEEVCQLLQAARELTSFPPSELPDLRFSGRSFS